MDFLGYYDDPYGGYADTGPTVYNDMTLPPTSGYSPSGSSVFDTIKSTASGLFGVWNDYQKTANQAEATRLASEVEKARIQAGAQQQLSGVRIGQALTAANESVELARARAIAASGSPKPSAVSQYLPLILLALGGLVAYKAFK